MKNKTLLNEITHHVDEITALIQQAALTSKHDDNAVKQEQEPGLTPEFSAFLAMSESYDRLMHLLLDTALQVVQAGGAGLTLLESKSKQLIFTHAVGDGSDSLVGVKVPLKGSVHGLAFATGEVQATTPMYKEVDALTQTEYKNVLVAPLYDGEQVVGTMSAVNKKGADYFSEQDVDTYTRFSELAMILINNQRKLHFFEDKVINGRAYNEETGNDEVGISSMTFSIVRSIIEIAKHDDQLLIPIRQFITSLEK